jgi:hypothetical protein
VNRKVVCSFCGVNSENHHGVIVASTETEAAICDRCIGISVGFVVGHVQALERKMHKCMEIMRCNDPGNAREIFGQDPAEVQP